MCSITFAIDDTLKREIERYVWINLSELVKQELLRREKLLKKFNSKEEQELIKWSVELGRKAKKNSFKNLLSKLSPEKREELLKVMSTEKREEYK